MTTDAINYNGYRIVDGIPQLDGLRWKGDLDLSFCTVLTMLPEGLSVNRRANGTPYRRAKGTPFHDGARLIGHAPLRCARRREGGARPEARAAQSIF